MSVVKGVDPLPPILRLPTEVRLMIFEPLLTANSSIVWADLYDSPVSGKLTDIRNRRQNPLTEAGGTGLILTCKTISQEASLIIYRSNTFDPSRNFTIYGSSPADQLCYRCQIWYRQGGDQNSGDGAACCLSSKPPRKYIREGTHPFFSTIGRNNSESIRRLSFNRFWPELEEAFKKFHLPNVVVVFGPPVRYRHARGESCQAILLQSGDLKGRRRGDWSYLYRTMLKVVLLAEEILLSHPKLRRLTIIDPISASRVDSCAGFRLLAADEELLDREAVVDIQKVLANIKQWHGEHADFGGQSYLDAHLSHSGLLSSVGTGS